MEAAQELLPHAAMPARSSDKHRKKEEKNKRKAPFGQTGNVLLPRKGLFFVKEKKKIVSLFAFVMAYITKKNSYKGYYALKCRMKWLIISSILYCDNA